MIRIILLVLFAITISTCGAIAQWYRYDYDYPRVGRWYPPPLPGPRPYLGQPGYYDRSWGNPQFRFGPFEGRYEHGLPVMPLINCYAEPWRCPGL